MTNVVVTYSRVSIHLLAPPQSYAYSPPLPLEGVSPTHRQATSVGHHVLDDIVTTR